VAQSHVMPVDLGPAILSFRELTASFCGHLRRIAFDREDR
jgi:hypothetical protein